MEFAELEFPLPLELENELIRFRQFVDESNKQNTPPDIDPKTVFHYTRAATAPRIVESQAIRFGEYKGMDDRFEVEFGKGFARQHSMFLSRKNKLKRAFVELFWQQVDGLIDKHFHFLIFSTATTAHNSALWQSYGEDHAGVAFEIFTESIDEEEPVNKQYRTTRFPVRYGKHIVDRYQRKLTVEVMKSVLLMNGESYGSHQKYDFGRQLNIEYGIGVLFNSLLFKSKDWQDQDEYRFLIIGPRDLLDAHPDGSKWKMHDDYEGWCILSKLKGENPIKAIHLGKKCTSATRSSIERAMELKGLSIPLLQQY